MADSRQLEVLQKGSTAWNQWRSQHADARVDLSNAVLVALDLREANLSGANLSGAHLAGAFLDRAQLENSVLRNAKLFRAHLGDANLKGADLQDADLGGAHLGGADLSGTNLRGAQLKGTNFFGAVLDDANLAGARLGRTIFANVDLSLVQGLDEVAHLEPSTIGLDAYFKSPHKIPAAFLIGSGISQPVVDYLAGFPKTAVRAVKNRKPSPSRNR